jgi:hypothetical protein
MFVAGLPDTDRQRLSHLAAQIVAVDADRRGGEHRRGGQRGQGDQHGFRADQQQPTGRGRQRVAAHPNAARESTMVGADPRLPASETKPTSRKPRMMPATPAIVACQKLTPKPRKNEP